MTTVDVDADAKPATGSSSWREGRIVGIGASAGGLESLEQLFSALPKDTGLGFVVVQHLSPDFRSLMDELIGRNTEMPVVIAENGMAVEPNRVHLMPPGKEMIIRDRHLWLTDKEPHTFTLPIDAFFRSLAQDAGAKAVAIVLSGSGSDGSRGIVDVKNAGGLVLAETSTTAKFDGMPVAATESGAVDHVRAPGDLARILCGLGPLETQPQLVLSEDPNMDAALRMLRDTFGIDFSLYKMSTVGRRIQRRVEILRLRSFAEYVEMLRDEPTELDKLYQDLLIGVTQFFRDPEAFAALETDVIPKLVDNLKQNEELRVWTAGCATGEESYSLAMLFLEAFERAGRTPRIKILATDVHQRSLDYASAGVYGEDQLANVTTQRLERFFTRRSTGFQISQDLRQLIVFARHNVIKDAPFTKMHFISCRNMLIYLQPPAQRTVLSLFHFGLVSGGTLFLGASETPGVLGDEFTVVNEHWKLFRKRRDVHLLGQVRLPHLRSATRPISTIDIRRTPSGAADPLILATYDQLLDLFMPPGLLVDEQHVLVDTYAGAEKLLRFKPRRPTSNVLDLLGDDLRTVVSGAMQRAFKDRATVSYSGVRIPKDDGEIRCEVSAQPLVHPRTNVRNVLITFRELDEVKPQEPTTPISMSEASAERMSTLETELQYTRETLQATIEELETSNEEMQATNEELVASNEELQSTNEELHSVNEELYTVNAEYQQKITELKELNADMSHLLEGTDVGTVFLDSELRIRRFTSQIAKVFRFQATDIGRRISDFSHNIERPQLISEVESSLQQGTVVEDEVRDRNRTPYFLRILPYRVNPRANGNGHATHPLPIDGVVLTLTDLTALDKARTNVEQLSAIVEWAHDAMFVQNLEGIIVTWNRGAEKLYGYTAAEAIGKSARMLMGHNPNELAGYLAQISCGDRIEHATTLDRRKDGTLLDVSVTLSPIYNQSTIIGASTIVRDISKLVETQRALETEQAKVKELLAETEELAHRREQFLAMLSHELRNPLAAILSATTVLEQKPPTQVIDRCQSVIQRQATHMKRLLDDLLDVSRITSDKFSVDRVDLDIIEAVETAIESTAPLLQQRAIVLDSVLPKHPVPMRGDIRRLTQVVANLLSNAATYSPPGTRVKLSVTTSADQIVIHVRDHGDGIDPALQPKIFDLFVQAEQKLDRSRGGLGVGLSLARTIVSLHGGSIRVHSDGVGKGSDFEVVLPLTKLEQHEARDKASILDPCKIVLIDDQDDSRDMLRVMFEAKNHVVFDGCDGGAALELISEHKPHIAFIDIGLPVMNGFEVAQQIRRRPELQDVVLVALSGYGNHADVTAALEAGFDEHVTKPAEFSTLEQILARTRRPLVARDDA
jgi:two-component system CheB/CheR fusion protein